MRRINYKVTVRFIDGVQWTDETFTEWDQALKHALKLEREGEKDVRIVRSREDTIYKNRAMTTQVMEAEKKIGMAHGLKVP